MPKNDVEVIESKVTTTDLFFPSRFYSGRLIVSTIGEIAFAPALNRKTMGIIESEIRNYAKL